MSLDLQTFKELLDRGINAIGSATSGAINFFDSSSVVGGLLKSTAFFAEYLQRIAQRTYNARNMEKATGDDLDDLVAFLGITRKAQEAATGVVTFSVNTAPSSTFYISSGSVVATQPILDGSTINFTVNETLTFPSGSTYITGVVTCTSGGVIGNVSSGKITNNISAIPGIDSINNGEGFGSGRERETDSELRLRVPLVVNGYKRGVEEAIRAAALGVSSVTYADFVENDPQTGTFTVYITTANGIVSQAIKDAVSGAVQAARGFTVPFEIQAKDTQNITISGIVKKMSADIDETYLINAIRTELNNFISVSINNELKISDIIIVVRGITGVKDITNVAINGVSSNYTSTSYEIIRLSDVTNITMSFTT